jgi:hypothetical protein
MLSLNRFCVHHFLIVAALLIVQPSCLAAQSLAGVWNTGFADGKKWEQFDFAKQQVDLEHIKNLEGPGFRVMVLEALRGIVFGRHGRIFKEQELQGFLQSRSWYKPNPNFQNAMLNDTERKNLDMIREAEARERDYIQLGDMRFYRDRLVTEAQLGARSPAESRVLRAEIEAIHGKRFDDEPWLQRYFEERYWYSPSENYDPKQLSEIERQNLRVIALAEKKQRKLTLSPGDMHGFQTKLISEGLLRGLGLYELRILRNEIYALRGRRFRTEWIQKYFNMEDWYEPLPDFREPILSPAETKNIATIVKVERGIHEELSTKPLADSLLAGLFLEDARKLRNEIYARHGRIFKDKWLQSYFASFNWYKPDAGFREDSLSEIERKNVETILEYEREALSEMNAFEG